LRRISNEGSTDRRFSLGVPNVPPSLSFSFFLSLIMNINNYVIHKSISRLAEVGLDTQ